MPSIDEIRSELYRVAARPDADPAQAALWIAAEEYPELDHASYLGYLDQVAETVQDELGAQDDPELVRQLMTREVFVHQGFAGNASEYYDPRNSYLNEVIDRRMGIPITLAVVYMEVSRRIGFAVDGVGLPGHFIARH